MHHISSAHIHKPLTRIGYFERQRTILIISPGDGVPERLMFGIERQIPWVTIAVVDNIAAACSMFPDTVTLILVHPKLLNDAERSSAELQKMHPLALAAVIELDPNSASGEIFASSLIRGVLPLGVKLDVTLSVIAFMLNGGEYFPRAMFHATIGPAAEARVERLQQNEPDHREGALRPLTKRELQILELVARGLQNKTIATTLSVSEFTVKIHLHNIITKLGTHNRTGAAALYRNSVS